MKKQIGPQGLLQFWTKALECSPTDRKNYIFFFLTWVWNVHAKGSFEKGCFKTPLLLLLTVFGRHLTVLNCCIEWRPLSPSIFLFVVVCLCWALLLFVSLTTILHHEHDLCVYIHIYIYIVCIYIYICAGAGIAQWLEHRTRDWKVAGSNPCWNGGRILFSRVDFLCWLLFRYPFHPRVTTVARKKSWSFCQKCRWQVTAKHAYTLRMWILLNRASALVTTCP